MRRQKIAVAAVAGIVAVVGLASAARAGCDPPKRFATFNTVEEPAESFIRWGPGSEQSSAAVIGRFWQAGSRVSANEGSYDDALWLLESPANPGQDMWILDGDLGAPGVFGCPAAELIVLGQNVTADGADALYFAARVEEMPGRSVEFDFSTLGTDFTAARIPAPEVLRAKQKGHRMEIDLRIPDPGGGVYGAAGTLPQETLTGVRLYEFVIPDQPPPITRDESTWIFLKSVPYTGGDVLTSLTVDCPTFTGTFLLAVGLEFDGAVSTDYVGRDVTVQCKVPRPKTKGKPH